MFRVFRPATWSAGMSGSPRGSRLFGVYAANFYIDNWRELGAPVRNRHGQVDYNAQTAELRGSPALGGLPANREASPGSISEKSGAFGSLDLDSIYRVITTLPICWLLSRYL
jgi:hypothetical protein